MEDIRKSIDESWKENVNEGSTSGKKEETGIPPEPDFSFFVSTLALQVSVFLGQIPNPATNQKEKNMPQAKFIIDTLSMLKEKTKNNLDNDENNLLENMLHELRMQYVSANEAKT